MGRQKPAPSLRHGPQTSLSTPSTGGAVLPILYVNGYKTANPTVPGRMDHGHANLGQVQPAQCRDLPGRPSDAEVNARWNVLPVANGGI
jgi:XFP N-terminal domain